MDFKSEIKSPAGVSRWHHVTVNKWVIVTEPNHLNEWFIQERITVMLLRDAKHRCSCLEEFFVSEMEQKQAIWCSVVTILEFLTSIRYLEKYRYSIPFSIPGREKKTATTLRGSIIIIFFDKYNMTMRYILHEQKCLEVVHLFKV